MSADQREGVQVRLMVEDDWDAVQGIYAQGITTGNATFEERVPTKAEFLSSRIPELRIVAEDVSETVVGWAAASPTSARPAYLGVVEHSVTLILSMQARASPPF